MVEDMRQGGRKRQGQGVTLAGPVIQLAVKTFGAPAGDQWRPVGRSALERLRQALAMGLDFSIEGQHRRRAFGKTRIPKQMLGHQHVVQRAVDAFEKQARVAPIVCIGHARDRFEQAVRDPDLVARLHVEVAVPSRCVHCGHVSSPPKVLSDSKSASRCSSVCPCVMQ